MIRAVSAEFVMPRFQVLESHEIEEKAPGELATIADREAEQAITSALRDMDPGATIIGEEAVGLNADLMHEVAHGGSLWLIDPIDGTNNFIKGLPSFAVMLAHIQDGMTSHAWIYQPVTGDMAIAEKGAGAWLNGGKLQRPAALPVAEMIGAAHIKRFPVMQRDHAKEALGAIRENRPQYCAGLDYVALCTGKKHFSLYSRTLPWDHVPGALLYKEAGGYVARLNGREYNPSDMGPGLLSAPDQDSWLKLQKLFSF